MKAIHEFRQRPSSYAQEIKESRSLRKRNVKLSLRARLRNFTLVDFFHNATEPKKRGNETTTAMIKQKTRKKARGIKQEPCFRAFAHTRNTRVTFDLRHNKINISYLRAMIRSPFRQPIPSSAKVEDRCAAYARDIKSSLANSRLRLEIISFGGSSWNSRPCEESPGIRRSCKALHSPSSWIWSEGIDRFGGW